jgi:hypothetical protein
MAAAGQAALRSRDGFGPESGRSTVDGANGGGPRNHPAIAHLNVGPLGGGGR